MHDLYYNWLCSLIDNPNEEGLIDDNQDVLEALYNKVFYVHPDILMDENRVSDGLSLRRRFEYEKGLRFYNFHTSDCTLLELMVALSIRCEEEILGNGDQTYLFWCMIDNLELRGCTDEGFIDYILNNLINRKYEKTGKNGCLFRVKFPQKSLDEVEIWYQMCWYISETMKN